MDFNLFSDILCASCGNERFLRPATSYFNKVVSPASRTASFKHRCATVKDL
jgi:hypothetical protein